MSRFSALLLLCACSTPDEDAGFTVMPCVPGQDAPYADGTPYLGVHAEPGNSDVIPCQTAASFGEAWHALPGQGVTQPNTFSPDGQTLYVTSSSPEPDGCRLHALDAQTGETQWCQSHPDSITQSAVEVDQDGALYFTAAGAVVSLEPDGSARWTVDFAAADGSSDPPWGLHFTPDGHIATVTSSGVVALLRREDGAILDTLDIPQTWGFVAPVSMESGLDVTALLPEAVQDDITAIWGDDGGTGFGAFLGAGSFCDNTLGVSDRGWLYVIGGGLDEESGALVQIQVTGSAAAPPLSPGWYTPARAGSATSPSISPGDRHVVISDGSSVQTFLNPGSVAATVKVMDIDACDQNTDADPDPAICGVAYSEALQRGAMPGSPAIDAEGVVTFYEFGLDFSADPTDRDLVAFGPDGIVWEAALPEGRDWTSVVTVTDDHLIGTMSTVVLSEEQFFSLYFPTHTEDALAVVDRWSGELLWETPLPDDSAATVTVGPDGALYVGALGLLSMLSIDERPTLGIRRFSPLAER